MSDFSGIEPNRPQIRLTGFVYAAAFGIGILCATIVMWAYSWIPQLDAIDIDQGRLNRALPAPQTGQTIEQTFYARHNGLRYVEVTIVNQGEDEGAALGLPSADLSLYGPEGQLISSRPMFADSIEHNQTFRLVLPQLRDSQDRPYRLVMTGSDGNPLSLWGYTLNRYENASLQTDLDTNAEILTFKTGYRYRWADTGSTVQSILSRVWPSVLLSLIYIPAPGLLVIALWNPRWPILVRWGAAVAIGIAIWPLLWLWLTMIGGHWRGVALWILVGLCWAGTLIQPLFTEDWAPDERFKADRLEAAACVLFLLVVFGARLVGVRDTPVLPWVDSGRHALITAVMRDSGEMLFNYEPYLPVDVSPYHTGFHTLSAGVSLIGAPVITLDNLLLGMMQLLSTLLVVAIYSGAWLLTEKRSVGWSAAFLVGLPFFFPAYYTTWGRLTQLSGLIVLPVLVGLTWLLLKKASESRRPWWLVVLFVALASGLFLLHARVFLFFLVYPMVVGPIWWMALRIRNGRFRWDWGGLALIVSVGIVLLVGPKLWLIWVGESNFYQLPTANALSGYQNRFPTGYLTAGWERPFWVAGAVLLALSTLVSLLIGRMERLFITGLSLVAWMGVSWLLVGGENIMAGWPILLPKMTVNALYISFFIPLAIALSAGAIAVSEWLVKKHWILHLLVIALWGAWGTTAGWFGLNRQADLLNETTFLVREPDLAGLEWIAANTPSDAKIGHSAWNWLNNTWAGSDGGAWIVPLTGRASTTPPIDHIYSRELAIETRSFNRAAMEIEDWSQPAAADLVRQYGVDYLFVGERGGFLDPAQLHQNRAFTLVYDHPPVFIYEVEPED